MPRLLPTTLTKLAHVRLRMQAMVVGDSRFQWRLFICLIALTTLLPYVIMPLSVYFGKDVGALLLASTLLNFLGGHAHVSTTAFFYSDPTMREHFREHKLRYVYAPIILILGVGLAYMITPEPYNRYILLYHFMWQTYHYQRQNFGVLSFISAATDGVPVSRLERLSLEFSAAAGMLALIKVNALSHQTILEPFTSAIFVVAGLVYAVVPALVFAAVITEPRLLRNPVRICALILFSAFYLPSFIFTDPVAAILGYALGHGLQYLVFMYYVGVSRPRPGIALTSMVAIGIIGGSALTFMTSAGDQSGSLYRLIFGMAIGTVMSHFVIDAGVWKLRYQFQRRYMQNAFSFVFARQAKVPYQTL